MSAGGGPRMHAALPALLLALWAAPGAADDAPGDASGPGSGASVPAQASEAVAAQPEETAAAGSDSDESGKAPASGRANASVSEADEAGQSAEGGLLSRFVEWLRGGDEDGGEDGTGPAGEGALPGEPVTLAHVHQAIGDMRAEIEILRRAMGVADAVPEVEPREGVAPVHVRVKTLEVLEKTARVQRRLGMIAVEPDPSFASGFGPEALYRAVREVVSELRRVKRQLVVEEAIGPLSVDGAKTPSALYDDLARASLLLDALVGRPATLNDVQVRIAQAHAAMRAIAVRLDAPLDTHAPVPASSRTPREVAQQLVRACYKAISLQISLGMQASSVPAGVLAQASEAEALEAANFLLGELLRVGAHLGVEAPDPEPDDVPPSEMFAQALHMVSDLDALIRAAADDR